MSDYPSPFFHLHHLNFPRWPNLVSQGANPRCGCSSFRVETNSCGTSVPCVILLMLYTYSKHFCHACARCVACCPRHASKGASCIGHSDCLSGTRSAVAFWTNFSRSASHVRHSDIVPAHSPSSQGSSAPGLHPSPRLALHCSAKPTSLLCRVNAALEVP